MNIIESIETAIKSISGNKTRALLTMLGIIIGISSVITILAIGQAGKEYITGQFKNMGINVINVKIKSTDYDIGDRDYFTMEDAKAVKERIENISSVVPAMGQQGYAKSENASYPVEVIATTDGYVKLVNIKIIFGRSLKESDIEGCRNVAMLDEITAKKLFKTVNAIGKSIKIDYEGTINTFSVVGIMKDINGNIGGAFEDNLPGTVVIPMTLGEKVLPKVKIDFFGVMMSDMNRADEAASKIVRVIEKNHNNKGKYTAQKGFKELDMINNILNTLSTVFGAVAAISLLVGGIGIMNIMLVSVTERTREIGVRKSLGAKQHHIRMQFLVEAVILCLLGGLIGLLIGTAATMIAGKIMNIHIGISLKSVVLSVGFSSVVGIFFGLYPANMAALLDPIEALRYE